MIRAITSTSRSVLPRTRFLRIAPRSLHMSRSVFSEEKKEDAPKEEAEATKDEAAGEETVESLKADLKKKDDEIADLKKKFLTSLADMQNLRTRTTKDVDSAKKYGAQSFAKSMLEVGDNLTMAINHSRADATEENPKLKSFFEGVEMTEKAMLKSFEANSVVKMEVLDKKFDPNFHDGMFQYADPTKEDGTVGQVVKDGYMLRDRVLRPAQVGTIKN